MKTFLEIAHKEWAACYEKLLDIYVAETAETHFSGAFKAQVKRIADIDLDACSPMDHYLDGVLGEIRAFHLLITYARLLIWEYIDPDSIYDAAYLASELGQGNIVRDALDIADMEDEYDPYHEDIYHEDDPRLRTRDISDIHDYVPVFTDDEDDVEDFEDFF